MEIPSFGIGTYTLMGETCQNIIEHGIKMGYRLIDNAELYKNQADIKIGLKKVFDEGIISRDQIWITSKIHNKDQRHLNISSAIEKILNDLDLEYIDLILLHSAQKNYVKAYEELLRCKTHYNIRHIGVSNFRQDELENIIERTGIVPYINQLEITPFYQRNNLRSFMQQYDIKTQAYCSLTLGKGLGHQGLTHDRYTPDELLLGWAKFYNLKPIPTMFTIEHLRKNYHTLNNLYFERPEIEQLNSITDQIVNYKQHMDK